MDVKSKFEITKIFNESSIFTIDWETYAKGFESSDEGRCPVAKYLIAAKPEKDKMVTELIPPYVKISATGLITFDFKNLAVQKKEDLTFYVAGFNKKGVVAFLPVTLVVLSIKKFSVVEMIDSFIDKAEKKDSVSSNITVVKQKVDILRMKLSNVNFQGEAVIRFSHNLLRTTDLNFLLSEINEDILDVKVYNVEKKTEHPLNWMAVSLSATVL